MTQKSKLCSITLLHKYMLWLKIGSLYTQAKPLPHISICSVECWSLCEDDIYCTLKKTVVILLSVRCVRFIVHELMAKIWEPCTCGMKWLRRPCGNLVQVETPRTPNLVYTPLITLLPMASLTFLSVDWKAILEIRTSPWKGSHRWKTDSLRLWIMGTPLPTLAPKLPVLQ